MTEKNVTDRKHAFRQRAELQSELQSGLEAESKAETHARECQEAARTATDALNALLLDGRRRTNHLDHQIDALDRELRATADPLIAAFGQELRAERLELLDRRPLEPREKASLRARLEALPAAKAEAEALMLLDLSTSEVGERIEALRDGLPPIRRNSTDRPAVLA